MKIDRVKLSPVKGRNQIIITVNKELLKGSDFCEGEYVTIICEKNKMTIAKEDQIKMAQEGQIKVVQEDQIKVSQEDQIKVSQEDQIKINI